MGDFGSNTDTSCFHVWEWIIQATFTPNQPGHEGGTDLAYPKIGDQATGMVEGTWTSCNVHFKNYCVCQSKEPDKIPPHSSGNAMDNCATLDTTPPGGRRSRRTECTTSKGGRLWVLKCSECPSDICKCSPKGDKDFVTEECNPRQESNIEVIHLGYQTEPECPCGGSGSAGGRGRNFGA